MKRYIWLGLPLAVGILLLVLGTRLTVINDHLSPWFVGGDAIPVRVVQVRRGHVTSVVRGSGELQAVKAMDIISPLAGVVGQVRLKAGESVREGQVVATVRAGDFGQRLEKAETALKLAENTLRKRESQLSDAEKRLEKTRELRNRDLIATREVTAAEADAAAARAERDLAQAQVAQHEAALAQLRHLLALSNLVAPFAGVVTRRWLEPGTDVQSGQPVLAIADLDILKVMINIPEKDLSSIRKGLSAQVELENDPGRIFEGQVSSLHSASRPTDHASVAEIHLANRERHLSAGLMVTVSLLLDEKRDALLAPKQAVFEVAGKNYVYSIVDRRAQQKFVTTGGHEGEMIEITDGISEGEWIVAEPRLVKMDRKVHVVKNDPER